MNATILSTAIVLASSLLQAAPNTPPAAPIPVQVLVTGNATSATYTVQAYIVPVGKRLVIESVTVGGSAPNTTGAVPHSVYIVTGMAQASIWHSLAVADRPNNLNTTTFTGTHAVKLFSDPGTLVHFIFQRDSGGSTLAVRGTISGYLIDAQ